MITKSYAILVFLFLAADLSAGVMNGSFSNTGVSPDPFSDWTTDERLAVGSFSFVVLQPVPTATSQCHTL